MNSLNQELKKIEQYNQLGHFDVSIFMYKIFGIILGVSLFYKLLEITFFNNLSPDYFTYSFVILGFAYTFYVQRNIKKNAKKQKQIVFENVNVYQFIDDYFQQQNLQVNLDVVYHVVTAKILQKFLKNNNQEIIQEKLQSVNDKSIQASSLDIVNYLKAIYSNRTSIFSNL